MRRSSLLALLSAAALAACASSPETEVISPQAPQTTRIVGVTGASDMRSNPTLSRNVVKIDLPFANVFKALPAVYETLGIPITTSNAGTGVVSNDGLKLRRRLKDVSLGRYIDCGSTQGMPSAETYDIFLKVRTQLQPSEGGTIATTIIEASGRPASISGDYINCSSTGRLEERIGQMLGGQPPR